jgi:CRP/FNR family transcriptional regulator, nitrogen oxide reductase regulator
MERRRSPVELHSITPQQCTHDVLLMVLHQTPFFAPLLHEDVQQIASRFRQRDYSAGELIHHYGHPAERLEIVAAGTVKLTRPTTTGRDVLLDVLGPGSLCGGIDLLGQETYPDSAMANTDCCILIITPSEFRDILQAYPTAAVAALEYVSGRLRSAHDSIEQLSAYPVERRLAATLIKLGRRLGREDDEGLLIDMPLSRQDLADMTGATVETVSRVLSRFRQDGLINSGRRWVSIVDHPGLERLAEDVFI